MTKGIADFFHHNFHGLGDELEIRNDIPQEFQCEIYLSLLRDYRQKFGEESPQLREIEKPFSIGLLERALRTNSAISLPLVERVRPDYCRQNKD